MSKVDVIRRYIGSEDFYDLNGTEMLSKILAAMDEYAQEQVKLFAMPAVVKQRELLRSYNKFVNEKCLLAGGILSDFEIEKFEKTQDYE